MTTRYFAREVSGQTVGTINIFDIGKSTADVLHDQFGGTWVRKTYGLERVDRLGNRSCYERAVSADATLTVQP